MSNPSKAWLDRQKHRDEQGKYASYVAGDSAADELCGIGEDVVAEVDGLDLEGEVDWYVEGVESVSIIRNEDGSLSADVAIDVDSSDIVAPALSRLAGSYPGAYSQEFDTPSDWVGENRPSEYLLGEQTQDPDRDSVHVFRVTLDSTSVDDAINEAGKALDNGDFRRPPGPAAARVHEAVEHLLTRRQRTFDMEDSATKWAMQTAGAPEGTELDPSAWRAIHDAVDDFLQRHPGSFDEVPAGELGRDLIRSRCFSGGFSSNRHQYGKRAEDLEVEAHNRGGIRFWVDGDPEYAPVLRAHVDPPVPPGIAHQ